MDFCSVVYVKSWKKPWKGLLNNNSPTSVVRFVMCLLKHILLHFEEWKAKVHMERNLYEGYSYSVTR